MDAQHAGTGCALSPVDDTGDQSVDGGGNAGDDAREQDDGDAVAHTELGDLLTQPHGESGAGGEDQDDNDGGKDALVAQEALAAAQHVVAEGLEQADGHGGVAGDGGDLLLALFATLLGKTLKGGDGDGQQLNDDGAVDIGLDTQGQNGGSAESAAAHHVHHAQDGGAGGGEVSAQQLGVHKGNGNVVAKTEDEDDQSGHQQLLLQLRDLPCVADRLQHLRSPQPFLLRLRSSPWRKRKRRKPGR